MSAAWLTPPVTLSSSRAFSCDGFTKDQCDYYTQRWHFWYIADRVYALPTVAFFMCAIGLFTIGHLVSSLLLGSPRFRGPPIWQRTLASIRYLSYRGFHVRSLGWNSAPLGLLLLGLAGTTYFFCMDLIPSPYYWSSLDFGGSPPLATRSGWMALACMPFVFATASKTSWITLLTGVSHEKIQVVHRWTAYAFFVLALIHTFPFIIYHQRFHDLTMQVEMGLIFYWTGSVALVIQAWLTFASHSFFRRRRYELFKTAHFSAAAVFILIFFWHCDYTLTSWHYFIATAAVYVPCFLFPWLRTLFEYGIRQKARVCAEPDGFTRVTIPANMAWTPGQHCFLRFTGFGVLTALSAHPFTICSVPSTRPDEQSELVFYIRRQGGFTAKLHEFAVRNHGALVPVLVDGPYGGVNMQSYRSSDHLVVFAGGSGAGWTLPLIETFLSCSSGTGDEEVGLGAVAEGPDAKDASPRQDPRRPVSLKVILATRDTESRAWFAQAVRHLVARYPTAASLPSVHVQVHLTGEAAQQTGMESRADKSSSSFPEPISSPEKEAARESSKGLPILVDELNGRPNVPEMIQQDAGARTAGESLGVFVCGPATMQNDARNAVAGVNLAIVRGSGSGGAYLHCEHFSWA